MLLIRRERLATVIARVAGKKETTLSASTPTTSPMCFIRSYWYVIHNVLNMLTSHLKVIKYCSATNSIHHTFISVIISVLRYFLIVAQLYGIESGCLRLDPVLDPFIIMRLNLYIHLYHCLIHWKW